MKITCQYISNYRIHIWISYWNAFVNKKKFICANLNIQHPLQSTITIQKINKNEYKNNFQYQRIIQTFESFLSGFACRVALLLFSVLESSTERSNFFICSDNSLTSFSIWKIFSSLIWSSLANRFSLSCKSFTFLSAVSSSLSVSANFCFK